MAKKATPTKSGAAARKRAAAKPKAKTAPRKPARKTAARKKSASSPRSPGRRATDVTAADALFKLIESPLVADLLAVGATAALAAIAEHRFSRKGGTGNAVKAAGKAAAAAMGRRLSTEVNEIKKASKKAKGTAKA
jgi:hypothetical protein